MAETKIRAEDDLATLINVFETDPARQEALVGVLTEGIDRVFRHRPGFLSATVLVGRDGSRVVTYAQWRSQEDIQATMADPAAREYAKRAAEWGTPSPHVYSVASVVVS